MEKKMEKEMELGEYRDLRNLLWYGLGFSVGFTV